MGLSFTIAAGPRQRSHSQVRVPRDSRPHFTVSDSRLPSTWRARSSYLYSPGTGWPSYTPRHCVLFSSPPTTRRATVEVFDTASTQDKTNCRLVVIITSRHGPHRKHRFPLFYLIVAFETCFLYICLSRGRCPAVTCPCWRDKSWDVTDVEGGKVPNVFSGYMETNSIIILNNNNNNNHGTIDELEKNLVGNSWWPSRCTIPALLCMDWRNPRRISEQLSLPKSEHSVIRTLTLPPFRSLVFTYYVSERVTWCRNATLRFRKMFIRHKRRQ
jgi:hypothetical protein